jgi:hypothetical protein
MQICLPPRTSSSDTSCPTFTVDLSSLQPGAVEGIYSYVTVKGSYLGTNDNGNQLKDNKLTVQPRNCRSFPKGEWYVSTIQLFKFDSETKRSLTTNLLRANLDKQIYQDDDKDTVIGTSFVSFVHPDNLFDKVVDSKDREAIGRLLSQGCQFNLVDGFTPCEPADRRFYYVDAHIRQLEILRQNVKSPFDIKLPVTQQTAITEAIEANQKQISDKYNYAATVDPYAKKLIELTVTTNKTFSKVIYLPWEDAMPIIDYLHAELIGTEARIKALASVPVQNIMLTSSFNHDQDPGVLNIHSATVAARLPRQP